MIFWEKCFSLGDSAIGFNRRKLRAVIVCPQKNFIGGPADDGKGRNAQNHFHSREEAFCCIILALF